MPGGRMTRRGRLVRFVTEMVIRPSPIPSALTATDPFFIASSRLSSAIGSAAAGVAWRRVGRLGRRGCLGVALEAYPNRRGRSRRRTGSDPNKERRM